MEYNGWTNYATWRVNLEIFDGTTWRDYTRRLPDAYELENIIKEHALDIIDASAPEGLARDYARAFVDDVNWREIAQHLIEE
jgi:hypothetical protein